jgi:flagellar assembly factor FliW
MRLLKLPRILSLTLVMLLMLTLSSCIWGVEAPFKLSPVDYLGYIEDETPVGIKISGKLDSSVSCVLTIKKQQ